jgi:hypothetical protein
MAGGAYWRVTDTHRRGIGSLLRRSLRLTSEQLGYYAELHASQ